MKKPAPSTAAVWLILLLALALRIGYVAITPDYVMVHDARDYELQAVVYWDGTGPRPGG